MGEFLTHNGLGYLKILLENEGRSGDLITPDVIDMFYKFDNNYIFLKISMNELRQFIFEFLVDFAIEPKQSHHEFCKKFIEIVGNVSHFGTPQYQEGERIRAAKILALIEDYKSSNSI